MRMQDDDSPPFIQYCEERIEFRRTEIQPADICCQLDAVGFQRVERIDSLTHGCIHIGQRQGGAEQESSWMVSF